MLNCDLKINIKDKEEMNHLRRSSRLFCVGVITYFLTVPISFETDCGNVSYNGKCITKKKVLRVNSVLYYTRHLDKSIGKLEFFTHLIFFRYPKVIIIAP